MTPMECDNEAIFLDATAASDQTFTNLNFQGRTKKDLTLTNCKLLNCNFGGSDLSGLHLKKCKIFNCNFGNANLQDCWFSDCTFYDKEQSIGCQFKLADLRRAEFYECDISLSTFNRAQLFQLVLDHCRA